MKVVGQWREGGSEVRRAMLSDAQVKQFKAQGYTTAPTFFSAREVRALRAELNRLRRDGAFRNVATDGDGATHSKQKENLQICPLLHNSELAKALPFAW